MRTTIRLDEQLLTQAKEFAARTGRTLTAVLGAVGETDAPRERGAAVLLGWREGDALVFPSSG